MSLCSVRSSFARFVERAAALGATNGGWGAPERQLFEELSEAKERINRFLATDFDTPSVIRELRELVHTADTYILEREGTGKVPMEPIGSVSRLVVETLTLFGISSAAQVRPSSDHSAEIVKELVKFRSAVREAAKKSLKEKSGWGADLLGVCDDVRDRVLPELGIYLEDRPSGSIISLVPPTKKAK